MKKFFTGMIASIISFALLAVLGYGVVTDNKPLVTMAAAAYWVIILLGLVVGVLTLIVSYAVLSEKDEQKKQQGLRIVTEVVKKKNFLRRAIDWICFIAIAGSLSYSGWIFTAVCYVVVALIIKLMLSIARDNVKESTA
ncbi:hypothetical protein ACOMDM_13565 [Serratia plymuthica]|uniref:hypothetical protein n=1 Tax=Serratia plymuthica TaxID=82996 RepID=UPI003B9E7A5E